MYNCSADFRWSADEIFYNIILSDEIRVGFISVQKLASSVIDSRGPQLRHLVHCPRARRGFRRVFALVYSKPRMAAFLPSAVSS